MADLLCEELYPGKQLTIPLPFGGELRSLANIADGPPSDCALAHSLMLQITPMLAGMACMLKILKVIAALKDFASDAVDPTNIAKLVDTIGEMTDCLDIVAGPFPICRMIKAILALILAYLNCMIEAVESILEFQVGIDLDAAQGNPVLLDVLNCAQNNAQKTMQSMNDALVGIGPILELANMALSIVGQPAIEAPPLAVATPTLEELMGGADPLEPVKTIRDALQAAHDALPC